MSEIFIQILLSAATAIIGFLIGRANNALNLKREAQKERFEKLYSPFVKLYDTTHMAAAYNFTDFSEDIQKQYADLLVENMVYAAEFTRQYIVQFMMLYGMVNRENAVKDKEKNSQDENVFLNKTFNTICSLINGEFEYLKNKLYYDMTDRIRNKWVKKQYRKYAGKAAHKNALENNL